MQTSECSCGFPSNSICFHSIEMKNLYFDPRICLSDTDMQQLCLVCFYMFVFSASDVVVMLLLFPKLDVASLINFVLCIDTNINENNKG